MFKKSLCYRQNIITHIENELTLLLRKSTLRNAHNRISTGRAGRCLECNCTNMKHTYYFSVFWVPWIPTDMAGVYEYRMFVKHGFCQMVTKYYTNWYWLSLVKDRVKLRLGCLPFVRQKKSHHWLTVRICILHSYTPPPECCSQSELKLMTSSGFRGNPVFLIIPCWWKNGTTNQIQTLQAA